MSTATSRRGNFFQFHAPEPQEHRQTSTVQLGGRLFSKLFDCRNILFFFVKNGSGPRAPDTGLPRSSALGPQRTARPAISTAAERRSTYPAIQHRFRRATPFAGNQIPSSRFVPPGRRVHKAHDRSQHARIREKKTSWARHRARSTGKMGYHGFYHTWAHGFRTSGR